VLSPPQIHLQSKFSGWLILNAISLLPYLVHLSPSPALACALSSASLAVRRLARDEVTACPLKPAGAARPEV
jgi:hypothetical protein